MSHAQLHPIAPGTAAALLGGSRFALYLQIDRAGAVVGWNDLAAVLLSVHAKSPQPFTSLLTTNAAASFRQLLETGELPPRIDLEFLDLDMHPFAVRCGVSTDGVLVHILAEPAPEADALLTRTLLSTNQELAVMSRENARKSRELAAAKADLERVHEELKTSHWHLRKVHEVISVCMECGKIKSDDKDWEKVAEYLLKNSILTSHGLCPACAAAFEARLDDPR
ncbi:MAG TPA: hypothetical protein VJ997_14780 [Longimicrobiales bacterium]|nr:hypothetical protein [Longimicrobiales bacterium]